MRKFFNEYFDETNLKSTFIGNLKFREPSMVYIESENQNLDQYRSNLLQYGSGLDKTNIQ